MFEEILRFWLDREVGGFRVDVAHGLFKDPDLADIDDPTLTNRPSAHYHRPEVHGVYRAWHQILESYPAEGFSGARTAVGEVWADSVATLAPYVAPGELPQVFNFELVKAHWSAPALRSAIEATHAFTDGSHAPCVIGNHDVVRPVTRWGELSVAAQDGDPGSFLTLCREALRIRRRHPALGTGLDGTDSMRWLEAPGDALFFARDPGFLFLANLGPDPLRLPEFREVLLASGPLLQGTAGLSDGSLPPDTAVWLSA